MRIATKAKPLAAALKLAASLADSKSKIEALRHARLSAEGDNATITANVGDFSLKLSLPAVVEVAGEFAVPSEKLANLAAGFPCDSEITISNDDKTAMIACGRSRFKLPTMPVEDVPAFPEIAEETGCVELDQALVALLSKASFAISAEQTRYYLTGVFLHDTKEGLTVVATDGYRMARAVVPGTGGLSQDRRLIIPRPAVKILSKLLGKERVTLRRGKTLLEARAVDFTFITKLIDAEFPAYERLIPAASNNTVAVERAALVQAVARVAAVAPETKGPLRAVVGLTWKAPDAQLQLCLADAPDMADDIIDAEVAGAGRAACQIQHLAQLLDNFSGKHLRIDHAGNSSPLAVTDPDDADFFALQMPVAWSSAQRKAA